MSNLNINYRKEVENTVNRNYENKLENKSTYKDETETELLKDKTLTE